MRRGARIVAGPMAGIDRKRLLLIALAACVVLSLVRSVPQTPVGEPELHTRSGTPHTPVAPPDEAAADALGSSGRDEVEGATHAVTAAVAASLRGQLCIDRVPPRAPVVIAGNRPVGTYLCEYFSSAKKLPGGCQLECGAAVTCTIFAKATQAQLYTSDVVVNHHGPVPLKRASGPLATMYYTGESNFSEPKKAAPLYLAQYDIVVSFHTFRRFHFTWTNRFRGDFESVLAGQKRWPVWHDQLDAVAVFVSRCKKGRRDSIIRGLARHMAVHSFGKCAQSHRIEDLHPECARLPGGRYPQKLCVFAKYRFALTLDNSHETDYVTEKVYHGLLSGALPIYDGAPNVADFLPLPDAVVLLDNYADSVAADGYRFAEMAAYLKSVETASHHFRWRGARQLSDWSPGFVRHLAHEEPTCAICRDVAEMRCQKEEAAATTTKHVEGGMH